MNSVKYLLFYMELFCDMFGSILECYELTHNCLIFKMGLSILWKTVFALKQVLLHNGIVESSDCYSGIHKKYLTNETYRQTSDIYIIGYIYNRF